MSSPSPLFAHRTIILIVGLAAALGFLLGKGFLFRGPILESPHNRVRPWAEDHFKRLTAPVQSAGNPCDPQFMARHGKSIPSTDPNYDMSVEIEKARSEYIPNFEVIEWDAATGFTSKAGSGAVRWLAAKPYDLKPGWEEDPALPTLTPYHPDGRPMNPDEVKSLEIGNRDLEAWGLEINNAIGTAIRWNLDFQGFANLKWKIQDVFDADTQVSVRQNAYLYPTNIGVNLNSSLALLHNAPVLAVIDLAHGPTVDFTLPVEKGASIRHADFHVDIIDVIPGIVVFNQYQPGKSGASTKVSYGVSSSPDQEKSFSVIYQVNPRSMGNAVSMEAIDANGNVIEFRGNAADDHAPAARFAAPLATATSLRVKYRPQQTRLLLRTESLPGISPENTNPGNLFDVKTPTVTFRNFFQMRRVVAAGSQLQDITGSGSYETPAAFPMTLENVSLRQVAERYLALDQRRKITIDPSALTIRFEPPRKTSFITRMIEFIKRYF